MNKQPSTAAIARDRLRWCMVNDKGGRFEARVVALKALWEQQSASMQQLMRDAQNVYPRGAYGFSGQSPANPWNNWGLGR